MCVCVCVCVCETDPGPWHRPWIRESGRASLKATEDRKPVHLEVEQRCLWDEQVLVLARPSMEMMKKGLKCRRESEEGRERGRGTRGRKEGREIN